MQRSVSMGPMSHKSWEISEIQLQVGRKKPPSRVAARILVVSWIDGEKRIQAETIHSIQLEKKNSIKFKIYFFSLNHFFFF